MTVPSDTSRKITKWVIRVAVAFVFVSTGLEKFAAGPGNEWIHTFVKIGFGDWFRYFTGAVEIAGGALLLVPITRMVGAALLTSCMLGAIGFHLFVLGDPFSSIINILLIVAIISANRNPLSSSEDLITFDLNTPQRGSSTPTQ